MLRNTTITQIANKIAHLNLLGARLPGSALFVTRMGLFGIATGGLQGSLTVFASSDCRSGPCAAACLKGVAAMQEYTDSGSINWRQQLCWGSCTALSPCGIQSQRNRSAAARTGGNRAQSICYCVAAMQGSCSMDGAEAVQKR